MSDRESNFEVMTFAVHIEQEKERLLPRVFDFVQDVDDMTSSTQVREIFDPFPEILEHRIKASWTKHNEQALRCTTALASKPGQKPTRQVVC